jgi:hypothetical protein
MKVAYVNRGWLEDKIEELIEEHERAINDERLNCQPHVFTWYYAKRKALADVLKMIGGDDVKWLDEPEG